MRHPAFTLACWLLLGLSAKAQTSQFIAPEEYQAARLAASPTQRIGVDFEIKGIAQPSPEQLQSIDLSQIEKHRLADQRNEYFEPFSGLTLIVYSATETTNKKTQLSSPPAPPAPKTKGIGGQ